MLQFYYTPISVNARRVWVALLEKQLEFEPILVDLDSEQFEPAFTAINPFQRVPVLLDDELRIVESLAILDYLEAKYPHSSLMPKSPEAIAIVRMVMMIAVNELQPATLPLTRPLVGLETDPQTLAAARERIPIILQFYEQLLARKSFFAEDRLTLAEIVAGTLVPALPMYGFSLETYPQLQAWAERLSNRSSWQQTTPAPEAIAAALPIVKKILERRS